jgi:hypothetical protein
MYIGAPVQAWVFFVVECGNIPWFRFSLTRIVKGYVVRPELTSNVLAVCVFVRLQSSQVGVITVNFSPKSMIEKKSEVTRYHVLPGVVSTGLF